MRKMILVAPLLAGTVVTAVAQTHPNFEGTWRLDKARSQYPGESAAEVIHQHGEVLDISITEKAAGHTNGPMQIHLTTGGQPTTNTVAGNKFTSTTHWEHDKLVTFVEGDGGQHMTETRELSSDGKTLTVTGCHQDELTKPYYFRVMVRSER